MNKHSKNIIILLSLGSLILLFFHVRALKSNSELQTSLKILKKEKIALLTEHEKCLNDKEASLKKELVDRYLDYMINLRNKIEDGYVPEKKEVKDFSDRSRFIIENMKLLELSTQEATQHLTFLAKMGRLVEEVSKKLPEKKADN
jgi:uncharacterized protein YpmS